MLGLLPLGLLLPTSPLLLPPLRLLRLHLLLRLLPLGLLLQASRLLLLSLPLLNLRVQASQMPHLLQLLLRLPPAQALRLLRLLRVQMRPQMPPRLPRPLPPLSRQVCTID